MAPDVPPFLKGGTSGWAGVRGKLRLLFSWLRGGEFSWKGKKTKVLWVGRARLLFSWVREISGFGR
jgi:hypothetical protein